MDHSVFYIAEKTSSILMQFKASQLMWQDLATIGRTV